MTGKTASDILTTLAVGLNFSWVKLSNHARDKLNDCTLGGTNMSGNPPAHAVESWFLEGRSRSRTIRYKSHELGSTYLRDGVSWD